MVGSDGAAAAAAVARIESLLARPTPSGGIFEKFDLSEWDWASVHIYLPEPEIQSAITPPFMEAFLVLQKQLYQLAALATTGLADVGQLGDAERNELLLSVVVTGGSSDLVAQLKKPLESLLNRMVGKMTGKQAAIVIVCLGALVASPWAFCAWLDQTKAVKLEEIKSKEHLAALQAMEFANKEQSEAFNRVIEILKSQGEVGKRALDVVTQTNEALLKAATSSPKTSINDVEVTRSEAELLRTPSRKRAQQKIVQQEVKVVDINTTDPLDLQIILLDPFSETQHRIKLKDDLFAGESRRKLFDALEKRTPLWVELAIKEIDGEVRSVQLLRTIERPADLVSDAEGDN
ncbi:hypothetical protein LUI11_01860 [Bradyrhizobium diazoefficiens]|uniref:Uncharacterized protein n=1 Tax=Bradyrhizobium diazoefficiens SEMIA 5080 TaxID=754504 RepID=A0A837CK38_9BRAD|nr:hypothetical protein [Bradyrhizobium diazoefficiens]APO53862.1 hypothetical protein BD122_26350 [Bradyrhizobium diazoefficiens]KGJ69629.1 hypothetical protein BJA5080_08393 [Bradyrhizobium diazoefficiens SEMIA 5080]KOY10851.1 hypothetical protein AF336_07830 [Bradyrhizobium diazoefficiens]MCD9292392.1 hypothetical protein [Bradyrhizobium diazoefficiens]MCD9810133.1 hypothetical protein [Bradyrhizobium diazoefficiens]